MSGQGQLYTPSIFEQEHEKTYNKLWVTSKDSAQPIHPPSMARFLVYSSLDSLEAVEGYSISRDSDQTMQMHRLI